MDTLANSISFGQFGVQSLALVDRGVANKRLVSDRDIPGIMRNFRKTAS